MPEERFSTSVFIRPKLLKTPGRKSPLQEAVNVYFPSLPAFLGAATGEHESSPLEFRFAERRNAETIGARKKRRPRGLTLPERLNRQLVLLRRSP